MVVNRGVVVLCVQAAQDVVTEIVEIVALHSFFFLLFVSQSSRLLQLVLLSSLNGDTFHFLSLSQCKLFHGKNKVVKSIKLNLDTTMGVETVKLLE